MTALRYRVIHARAILPDPAAVAPLMDGTGLDPAGAPEGAAGGGFFAVAARAAARALASRASRRTSAASVPRVRALLIASARRFSSSDGGGCVPAAAAEAMLTCASREIEITLRALPQQRAAARSATRQRASKGLMMSGGASARAGAASVLQRSDNHDTRRISSPLHPV